MRARSGTLDGLSNLDLPAIVRAGKATDELSGEALGLMRQNRFAEAESLWKQTLTISPGQFSA